MATAGDHVNSSIIEASNNLSTYIILAIYNFTF